MLPTCLACGKPHLPPGPVCPFFPAFRDETPYNVVQVELDEGPRLTSRIIGGSDQKIRIGQRVEVVFDDIDEELTLHGFRIVEP